MATQQRRNLTQRRRERTSQRDRQIFFASDTRQLGELVDNPRDNQYRCGEVPSFDHPSVIHKLTEFHNSLMSLASVKCTVCLENFPTLKVNATGICTRCHDDSYSPKLCSAQNNMDPGPVPPELKVSYQYAACIEGLSVLIKFLFVGRESRVFGCYSFYSICFLLIGIDADRRNAYFSSNSNDFYLQITTWAIWLQRTCH